MLPSRSITLLPRPHRTLIFPHCDLKAASFSLLGDHVGHHVAFVGVEVEGFAGDGVFGFGAHEYCAVGGMDDRREEEEGEEKEEWEGEEGGGVHY